MDSVNDLDSLVRLFVHEGLRLFHDRLVDDSEKEWCKDLLDETAKKHFPKASAKAL